MDFFRNLLIHIKRGGELVSHYGYDFFRYLRYASVSGTVYSEDQLRAQLVAQYHGIEKGLSLPSPRFGFGLGHLRAIRNLIVRWDELRMDRADCVFVSALGALSAYAEFHVRHGETLPRENQEIIDFVLGGEGGVVTTESGGVAWLDRITLQQAAQIDYSRFVNLRHSVRRFSALPVDESLIKEAVQDAQSAPSVCNRQASRVYHLRDERVVKSALSCQNGNAGFRDCIKTLLIVTTRLGDFCDPAERNQGFIDGGMFAMMVLLSLHARGLGACPLNWSATIQQDRSLRAVIKIENSENVIMMIAVGHLEERFPIARSARLSLDDVLHRL